MECRIFKKDTAQCVQKLLLLLLLWLVTNMGTNPSSVDTSWNKRWLGQLGYPLVFPSPPVPILETPLKLLSPKLQKFTYFRKVYLKFASVLSWPFHWDWLQPQTFHTHPVNLPLRQDLRLLGLIRQEAKNNFNTKQPSHHKWPISKKGNSYSTETNTYHWTCWDRGSSSWLEDRTRRPRVQP